MSLIRTANGIPLVPAVTGHSDPWVASPGQPLFPPRNSQLHPQDRLQGCNANLIKDIIWGALAAAPALCVCCSSSGRGSLAEGCAGLCPSQRQPQLKVHVLKSVRGKSPAQTAWFSWIKMPHWPLVPKERVHPDRPTDSGRVFGCRSSTRVNSPRPGLPPPPAKSLCN